jgi:hypothetical protein
MAQNSVWLRLDVPTIRIRLTPELQEIWNDIQFFEEAQQYDQYNAAWDAFLGLAHYDIMDQIADDYNVSDAGETRGA